MRRDCRNCGGRGYREEGGPCPACKGEGMVEDTRRLRLEEIVELNTLYRKYVGSGELNVGTLQTAVKRETRNAERGVIKVSRELLRELRADRARIGHLARLSKEG